MRGGGALIQHQDAGERMKDREEALKEGERGEEEEAKER